MILWINYKTYPDHIILIPTQGLPLFAICLVFITIFYPKIDCEFSIEPLRCGSVTQRPVIYY